MADTSFFLIGCIERQHAVILESIWETESIITRFPAQRTGLLTPLLTCLTLLLLYSPSPFLLGQIILSPSPFLPLSFLDKNFLSPTPISQKHSKTILNVVLAAKSFQPRKNILGQFQILS